MWLFNLYLSVITASGIFTFLHLVPKHSDKALLRRLTPGLFFVLSILLAFGIGYKDAAWPLSFFNFNWAILAFSLLNIWLGGRKTTVLKSLPARRVAFSFPVMALWAGWLFLAAEKTDNLSFITSLLTGGMVAFILIFLPSLRKRRPQTGYALAVIQCALAVYYLVEGNWSNSFSTSKPVATDVAPAFSHTSGTAIAIGSITVFIIGILSKYLKK
jgi:hypothetical protein